MRRIFVFGSINIDEIYNVADICKPGETIMSKAHNVLPGGKAVAAAKCVQLHNSHAVVSFVGQIGEDGKWILDLMKRCDIDVSCTSINKTVNTGRAIIQVAQNGENAIVLWPGANHCINRTEVEDVYNHIHGPKIGDFAIFQNEISDGPAIMATAKQKGLTVVFNPSPCVEISKNFDTKCVDILIVNRNEATSLIEGGTDSDLMKEERLIQELSNIYNHLRGIVVTLGGDGVIATFRLDGCEEFQMFRIPAAKVAVLDTTGAGDTFLGYFVGSLTTPFTEKVINRALKLGVLAAGIAVESAGAMDSIPSKEEVMRRFKH
ncbi:Ribokinase-like protein [Paraphysoderma sedebokerense]|nr:Ribokinase-like protein [Paraphysoderma sedebokerense]